MSRNIRPLVALATYAARPDLVEDDLPLASALDERGMDSCAVPWDDAGFAWERSDGVILRSCWDYHLRLDRFLEWVNRLEAAGVPLWNPPTLVRWNARKEYLRELESRGIPVVPTTWIERGTGESLGSCLARAGYDHAVVKPVVSASAFETWRTSVATADEAEPQFRSLIENDDVMIQPFLHEVVVHGEWSLVFFEGQFSHAVIKRPRHGDFRVQSGFGGTREVHAPPAELVSAARRVLDAAPDTALYARVDGCVVAGEFVLMELELIEPELFLSSVPGAATRMVDAYSRLSDGTRGADRAGDGIRTHTG